MADSWRTGQQASADVFRAGGGAYWAGLPLVEALAQFRLGYVQAALLTAEAYRGTRHEPPGDIRRKVLPLPASGNADFPGAPPLTSNDTHDQH